MGGAMFGRPSTKNKKPGESRSGEKAEPQAAAAPKQDMSYREQAERKSGEAKKKRANQDRAESLRSRLELDDLQQRQSARQFYRVLEKTQEWVENNYYHLPIAQRNGGLISPNPFWTDYAAFDGKGPFYSEHFTEVPRNFPEMMFALAVLDLPFQSPKHETEFADASMTLENRRADDCAA